MRTVSEKGETCGREGKPPGLEKVAAKGSERGRGRRDILWHRWMSFFSLWVAARELSLGEGATVEEEEEDEVAKWWGDVEEEGAARLGAEEEDRDVVWRDFETRLLVSPFRPEAWEEDFFF